MHRFLQRFGLSISALLLSLFFAGSAHATVGCNAVGYDQRHADVTGCTLYYPAIQWLYDQGIARGVQDKTVPGNRNYEPNRPVNRAEFTKLVLLASGVADPPPACAISPFPDVSKNEWYAPYICAAKERGIISGFPDGTFKPTIAINFANAAKILVKTFGVATNPADAQFDAMQNIWYRPYTQALLRNGATAESITAFASPVTRGEMAEMLFRLKTGQTSFTTSRDEDSGNLGMGFEPNAFEFALGFYLGAEPDPPFIFIPSERRLTEPSGSDVRLQGYKFSHVLQRERCGASGLFEHCTPLFADWSVGLYTTVVAPQTLKDAFLTDERTERMFGGKPGTCSRLGIEGEYTELCVVPWTAKKTLVVAFDFIDTSFAYTDLPGITPLATAEAIYARLRSAMQFMQQ